ncbi:hypothetical protein Mapa_003643 [Marchantia paleacea]|nr:hypothetical protein Mapa_003643 [Marchantia paleacea]
MKWKNHPFPTSSSVLSVDSHHWIECSGLVDLPLRWTPLQILLSSSRVQEYQLWNL